MNEYQAFYQRRELSVTGKSSYEAQQKAVKMFKAPKSKAHLVHVHLVAVDDEQYTHSTSEI